MDRPPRVRRAAIAGLGAGASLAAASLCILVLGAATVAFVPWGTPDARDRTTSATLREAPQPPAPAPAAAVVAQPRVTPATSPGAAPARPDRRRRAKRSRPARRSAPEQPPVPVKEESGAPAPTRTAPPAPAESAPDAPERAPDAPPPTPVDEVVDEARKIAGSLGDATAKISPDAGDVVQEATGTVTSPVEDVAALLP